jgi:uncharacterized membrane protein
MKISEIKKGALGALRGKWGLAVLATFVFFLIYMVVPMIIEMALSGGVNAWSNPEQRATGANIVNIIISLILIPFSIAFYWFFLSISRSETPQISELFTIYADLKTSLKLIGTSIVVSIFVILWSLLLIIPGIIKGLAYSQTFFVLRDRPELSITEAITESKKMMQGYKWKYFLLNLSFIGWAILTFFTLGIGLLWLIPYVSTSLAAFYDKLLESQ